MSARLLKSSVVNNMKVYGNLEIKQPKKLVLTYNHDSSHPSYETPPEESYQFHELVGLSAILTKMSDSEVKIEFKEKIVEKMVTFKAHVQSDQIPSTPLHAVYEIISETEVKVRIYDTSGALHTSAKKMHIVYEEFQIKEEITKYEK